MRNNPRKVHILDTTLRDGSYTVGYQFTADETGLIARGLELAGISYIEVGHGLGLGADRAGKGAQAELDIVYMRACANAIQDSKFGFFFIPEIGTLNDLKLLASENGAFVRIGVTPEAPDAARRAIEDAKGLGLEVWANIMKTYAFAKDECVSFVRTLLDSGVDGVYVVDSAGGMLPSEVVDYVEELKAAFSGTGRDPRIGFHGHENLAMGAACSLAAVEAGCDIVDGSLLGIGRSLGNAATEVLAMVLARAGFETGVDPWLAADLAEKMIRPFLEPRWRCNSLEQALGFAQIHSGYLPILEKVSKETHIRMRDLVLSLGPGAKRHVTENDVRSAAEIAILHRSDGSAKRDTKAARGDKLHATLRVGRAQHPDITQYANEVRSQATRMARPATMVLAGPWREEDGRGVRFQQIRLLTHAVVGAIEVGSASELEAAMHVIDGIVDVIFLDMTPRNESWRIALEKLQLKNWKSRILRYADEIAGIIGACHIVAIEAEKRGISEVFVGGSDERTRLVRQLLTYWGIHRTQEREAAITVIAGPVENVSEIPCRKGSLIFDLMSGSINSEIAQKLLTAGADVIRLDGRLALVGEVAGLLEAQQMAEVIMGRSSIDGVQVVAGGVWGQEGDIVINNITNPTLVIGVADGSGGIKQQLTERELASAEKVRSSIRSSFLNSLLGA